MDLFDLLIGAIWIFFVFRNFFKGKQQPKKQPRPQPREDDDVYQEPADNGQDSPYTVIDNEEEDPDEDERKLKEWLEKVFGKAEPQYEPEYEEPQEVYTEKRDYERELPAFMTEEPAEYEPEYDYEPAIQGASKAYTIPASTKTSNPWNGKLGKAQVAHGLVMAEILQKPRSLRPVEYIGARPRKRQLKKG